MLPCRHPRLFSACCQRIRAAQCGSRWLCPSRSRWSCRLCFLTSLSLQWLGWSYSFLIRLNKRAGRFVSTELGGFWKPIEEYGRLTRIPCNTVGRHLFPVNLQFRRDIVSCRVIQSNLKSWSSNGRNRTPTEKGCFQAVVGIVGISVLSVCPAGSLSSFQTSVMLPLLVEFSKNVLIELKLIAKRGFAIWMITC